MSYQVWVDNICYYTLTTLWEAKRKQKIYKKAFSWANVEIRRKEHGSCS